MKKEPPHIGAAVTAAVRTALRRVRPGSNGDTATPTPPRTPVPERTDERLDLAEERAASRDLLAIDAVVRRFYALSSDARDEGDWRALRDLFHDGARVGTGRPDAASSTGLDDVPIDRFIETARRGGTPSPLAERSRTVHVIGDLAVVISAFEMARGGAKTTSRGVHVLQLRLEPARGWRIQSVIARSEARAISEKSADPRPLASRRRE